MAQPYENNPIYGAVELLRTNGFDALAEAVTVLLNTAMVAERSEYLGAARKAVFPSVPWQRCQSRLQQNAGHYVPKLSLRVPVAADIRAIFNAPDQEEAEHLLERFHRHYEKSAPKLVQWAEEAIPKDLRCSPCRPATGAGCGPRTWWND